MDNLKELGGRIAQQIDPDGADESILAENHRDRLTEVMTKAGKFGGFYFLAKKSRTTFPAGTFSWDDNPINDANIDIIFSEKSLDSNTMKSVFESMGGNTVIHLKDFAGRSALYKFESVSEEVIGNTTVYRLNVNSIDGNPGYTYQDMEEELIGLSFYGNTNKIQEFGQLQIFRADGNKGSLSNLPLPGDTVIGAMSDDKFMNRGVYVSGDHFDVESYDDNSDFYDPNDI